MNPTLSTRLRGWQQSRYWRVHPPAPWAVPVEPATALLHLPAVPAPTGALAAVGLPVAAEQAVGANAVVLTAAVLAVAQAEPGRPEPPARAQPKQGQSPANLDRNSPRPCAAGIARSSATSQLSTLIGVVILAVVTLLEGWRAIRLLIGQIRAIWVAPAAGVRGRCGPFQPAVAVPVAVAGPVGPSCP